MNIHFDIAKVKRAINTHGKQFTFKHYSKNNFGEPTGEYTSISVKGLFHQTRGYITKNVSDGTIYRSKPQPQILTLVSNDATSLTIDDELTYNNSIYRVVGVDDVNQLGVALNISLEVFDNGS